MNILLIFGLWLLLCVVFGALCAWFASSMYRAGYRRGLQEQEDLRRS